MQLSRDIILTSALGILDKYGLADLTMRRLAVDLGTSASAIYWHIPSKQALLASIALHIVKETTLFLAEHTITEHTWRTSTATAAHALRLAIISHRDGSEVVSTAMTDTTVYATIHSFLGATLSTEFPAETVENSSSALVHYIIGATLAEQSVHDILIYGKVDDSARAQLSSIDFARQFDAGLTLFLDGIATQLNTYT